MSDDEAQIELNKIFEEFKKACEGFSGKKLEEDNDFFHKLKHPLNNFSREKARILSFNWYLDRDLTRFLTGSTEVVGDEVEEDFLEVVPEEEEEMKIEEFKTKFYQFSRRIVRIFYLNWMNEKSEEDRKKIKKIMKKVGDNADLRTF